MSLQVRLPRLPHLLQEAARARCEWRVPSEMEDQAEPAEMAGELAQVQVLQRPPWRCA